MPQLVKVIAMWPHDMDVIPMNLIPREEERTKAGLHSQMKTSISKNQREGSVSAQGLRAHAALAKDQGLIPTTHIAQPSVTTDLEDWTAFGHCGYQGHTL